MNADAYISTGAGILGYNMYAYCNNNMINYIDSDGYFVLAGMTILLAGVGVIGGLYAINSWNQSRKAKKAIAKVQKQNAPDETKRLNERLKKCI